MRQLERLRMGLFRHAGRGGWTSRVWSTGGPGCRDQARAQWRRGCSGSDSDGSQQATCGGGDCRAANGPHGQVWHGVSLFRCCLTGLHMFVFETASHAARLQR